MRSIFAALLVSLAFASGAAAAPSCELPAVVRPAPVLPAPKSEIAPGISIAYYVLALSWSPEFCRTRAGDPAQTLQCGRNGFRFAVHGLWPNGAGRDHPRYCAPAPAIDPATLRRHLCMMPSPSLIQHEWAAHGTCGWRDNSSYLAQTATLWNALRLPSLADAEHRPYTAGALRTAVARANPGLPRAAVAVMLDNRRRLTEVQICYDLRFRWTPCPGRRGAPDDLAIRITQPRP